jgi:hypothetical protein
VAGGERRRLRSGVRGRERPGWGDAVEDEESDGATGLGRERAEGRAPRWTELGGANGGRRGTGAREQVRAALL